MAALVVAVDVDGVVANYEAAFRAALASQLEVPPSTIGPRTQWSFPGSGWPLADEVAAREAHRHAVLEQGMLRSMEPVEGAAEALWALSDRGVHIRLVTHRLVVNFNHATSVVDTAGWLDEHRVPYRDLCFVSDKPSVQADVHVECDPHGVEALEEAGARVLVFDQPWNRGLGSWRARGWRGVLGELSALL